MTNNTAGNHKDNSNKRIASSGDSFLKASQFLDLSTEVLFSDR